MGRLISSPKVTITVGKEAYGGKTKSEANAKALEHLAQFMDGEGFVPVVVRAPDGAVGFTFRDANGYWAYLIHRPDQTHLPCVTSSAYSRKEAERKMRHHLAQAAYVPLGSRDVISLIVTVKEDVRDLNLWADYQDTYARAIADGKSVDEAWRIANPVP